MGFFSCGFFILVRIYVQIKGFSIEKLQNDHTASLEILNLNLEIPYI